MLAQMPLTTRETCHTARTSRQTDVTISKPIANQYCALLLLHPLVMRHAEFVRWCTTRQASSSTPVTHIAPTHSRVDDAVGETISPFTRLHPLPKTAPTLYHSVVQYESEGLRSTNLPASELTKHAQRHADSRAAEPRNCPKHD